jgi:hypothetical protein
VSARFNLALWIPGEAPSRAPSPAMVVHKRGLGETSGDAGALPVPKVAQAAAKAPGAGASSPSSHGANGPKSAEPPAPAVSIQAQMPADVPADDSAPSVPVLPTRAEADKFNEEKTKSLMHAVVAYNKYHVRRVMKQDSRWFKGWEDKPVHEHQPLNIRKPDSKDDLLSYVAPWRKTEATISFSGTGTYKGGGNIFWLDPFVDESRKLSS